MLLAKEKLLVQFFEFKNDITLNEDLFKKVKSVFDNRETLNLTPEQAMLLDKQYKSFARNGANLNEPAKIKLRKIDAKLSKLSLQFGENVLAETNAFEMHLTDENDLAGLPDSVRESAREVAKSKEKKGWVFTLDYPSYVPFLIGCLKIQLLFQVIRPFFPLKQNGHGFCNPINWLFDGGDLQFLKQFSRY